MADDLDAALNLLGLDRAATPSDVRTAHRRLAKEHHPDVGGGAASMGAINDAVGLVLSALPIGNRERLDDGDSADHRGAAETASNPASGNTDRGGGRERQPTRWARDAPSFVIEALPVEAFEALLLVAATNGEVLDDDPPYRLDAVVQLELHHLDAVVQPGDDVVPVEAWCRLDLVPDAGSSTVSLTVAIDASSVVRWATVEPEIVDAIRDWWIRGLNELDWPETSTG